MRYHQPIAFAVLFCLACGAFCLVGCGPSSAGKEVVEVASAYTYSVTLTAATPTGAQGLPALQSYAHATHGGKWLLFAGRTNSSPTNNNGGLHAINTPGADYAVNSFPPPSFNTTFYVVDPTQGIETSLTLDALKAMVGSDSLAKTDPTYGVRMALVDSIAQYNTVFRNSNPQVVQEGDYLYVAGGYGSPLGVAPTKSSYRTYHTMARIHVPMLMKLVSGETDFSLAMWSDLFKFGKSSTVQVTGGELKRAGDHFYLAAGHDFGASQVYTNCVYELDFKVNPTTQALTVAVLDTISDMTASVLKDNPKLADSTSTFRRRDLPVVSSLYQGTDGGLREGLALMAGVFKYGKRLDAWNDVIYITPELANRYVQDENYNQGDHNVYACSDFSVYDAGSETVHTFLPGGIGTGTRDDLLSGFTNTLGHATYGVASQESNFTTTGNLYPSSYYYGAEAKFFPAAAAKYLTVQGKESEVLDADATFGAASSVAIGYIYGGIESFVVSPGTYGSDKSGASDKLWQVTLSRSAE